MYNDYFFETIIADAAITGGAALFKATGLIIGTAAAASAGISSSERKRFLKTSKQWFAQKKKLPSPFNAKPISKKDAINTLKANNTKVKCKDLNKVHRAGGRVLKQGNEVIASSIWIEYFRDKTVTEIELVNFINPKYKRYKPQYCATLAVMSGNCSDSIVALGKKMRAEVLKNDPRNQDMIDRMNQHMDEIEKNKEEREGSDSLESILGLE